MADQLTHLLESPPSDPVERRKLYNLSRALSLALETPQDAMHRILWSGAQLPVTKLGVDLQIFRTLSSALPDPDNSGLTISQLAAPTSADPALVSRIVRYLSSFGLVDEELHECTFRPNDTTRWLATAGGEGGVRHFFSTITPVLAALPETLKLQNYQNPSDPLATAFQRAHNTTAHGYSWLPDDPGLLTAFYDYLKQSRIGTMVWTEIFPVHFLRLSEDDLKDNRVLFVDVGGGTGPQSIALRETGLKGRIVLQDTPSVLETVNTADLASKDIEVMPHDFFTTQPVRHAKAYYLKNIMHDWPDAKCILILSELAKVLAADSVILIQDCVLPNAGASWKMTQMDIQMMACLAAVERSKYQWVQLLASAGLRVKEEYLLNEETGSSIIVAVLD